MINPLKPLVRSEAISLEDWVSMAYNGLGYPLGNGVTQTLGGDGVHEPIDGTFIGYVQGVAKANGVVFACMSARSMLFSEARFQFRRIVNGRPGELFGTPALQPLETPWANGTTGDLLTRAIQDADIAGSFYGVLRKGAVRRLRPDWVTIIMGSKSGHDVDTEIVGYSYQPGGPHSGDDPMIFLPEDVIHWSPIPDPAARFRGMSWLTPILREISADSAATTHKLKFFENGATPNMVVKFEPTVTVENFDKWIDKFEAENMGVLNAYKSLYLGGGADATVVGADMKQLDFKNTQGAGETRIAAAAGIPPVIVGLSEGLQAATYSNYGQARRRLSDGTMRPLWRGFAAACGSVIKAPGLSELTYDDRDISWLQEDQKDAADIQQVNSTSIKTLIDAGYDPDTVVEAVNTGDLQRLKHTGLVSVQLQEPGVPAKTPAAPTPALPAGDEPAPDPPAGS